MTVRQVTIWTEMLVPSGYMIYPITLSMFIFLYFSFYVLSSFINLLLPFLIISHLSFFSCFFRTFFFPFCNSSVSIVTKRWVRGPRNRSSIFGRDRTFSLIQNVQTRGGTHPSFCSVVTEKQANVSSW
jgi:hypothetical protein